MRAVVQRVKYAKLRIEDEIYSNIDKGLIVYIGIHQDDEKKDIDYIVRKILGLRIFEDENEKMNLSIKDIDGEILLVSQFTLYGDARKGNRPSFIESAKGDEAIQKYNLLIEEMKKEYSKISTGVFGADMQIEYINDGPVTIQLDSSKIY